ncbi:MAG: glutathione S-transferase family protein [Myxococcota bacterium]
MTILFFGLVAVVLAGLAWFALEKFKRRTHPVVGGIDRSVTLPHTHPVELYSNGFSHCSRKARFVLSELGIETKHHPIDLIETGWYQTISSEYLKVNPAGLVPTLVHQGHPVFESDDILAYAQTIAGKDAPQLVPSDPYSLAKMNDWLSFCAIVSADLLGGMKERAGACIPGLSFPMFIAAIRYVPLRRILVGFLFHPTVKSPALFSAFKLFGLRGMLKQKKLRDLIHASRDHMQVHLETLNRALMCHGGPWILGNAFSLADISIGCMLLRLEETGWLRWFEQTTNIPEVTQYFQRFKARPAWSEAITAHAHPIIEQAKKDLAEAARTDPSLGELIYGPITPVGLTEREAA